METDKKKRSPNYTNEEKENLLSLVTKYKSIIDCKKTGAFYIQKKKEAWIAICKKYNSICTTGPRDEAMLKHFYNNIKHRARKVTASANKQRYLSELPVETNTVENIRKSDNTPVHVESTYSIDENELIDEDVIKVLKTKWIDEKKNIKKTGGGSYDPILTDADHQILSIMDDHIHPDENAYDDAAEYFGETIELTVEDPTNKTQIEEVKAAQSKSAEYFGETIEHTVEDPPPIKSQKRIQSKYSVPAVKKKSKNQLKPEFKNKSVELLRKIYFKKKIELVYYQKKNELQKFRYEQIKQELNVKILKKQLEKAEKENT